MNILHPRANRYYFQQIEGLQGKHRDEVGRRASLMARIVTNGLRNGASVFAWTEPGVLQENQVPPPVEVVAQPQVTAANVEPAELRWTGDDDAAYETAAQAARQEADAASVAPANTAVVSVEPMPLSKPDILADIDAIHDEALDEGLGYVKLNEIPGANQF